MATETPTTLTLMLVPEGKPERDAGRNQLVTQALPAVIETDEMFQDIAGLQASVRAFVKQHRPKFDAVVAGAYKAHTAACDLRTEFFEPLEKLERGCAQLLADFNRRAEAARRERERLATEAALKEQQRIRDQEAKLAKAQGDPERAAIIRNTPIVAPLVTQPRTVPPVAGLTFRTDWKWRPVGGDTPEARERAVKVVPREFLKLDESKLTTAANRHKGQLTIPGVEFYSVDVTVRR